MFDFNVPREEVYYTYEKSKLIKTKLTSPQSALVLRDLYDEMVLKIPPNHSPEEEILGCTLKRKEEDINDFIRYKLLLKEYVALGIKRYCHMSFKEYLQLNSYEAKWIREVAIEIAKEEKDVMEDVEKHSDKRMKRIRSADGLEELFDGEV